MKPRALATAAITIALVACSVQPQDLPSAAVRRALERVVVHDLAAASADVCVERRDPTKLPFSVGGIFAPLQALPVFDVPRTLAVIGLDGSGLAVTEASRDGNTSDVRVKGVLVETFDPVQVEALIRAYATESGQPVDDALLAETLTAVSGGPVALPVEESVRVVRENDRWRVCPLAPVN